MLFFAVSLSAGCGGLTRLAYDHAELAIHHAAKDYFELDVNQRRQLRPLVATLHRWHRQVELPRYEALLQGAAARVARGLTNTDLEWAIAQARERYRVLAAHAVDDATPVLNTLTAANIESLERKLAASTEKLEREYGVGDPVRGHTARLRAMRKPLEEWIGPLNAEQSSAIDRYAREAPQFSAERSAERRRRHREFVRLLAEHRGTDALPSQIKRYVEAPESAFAQRNERAVKLFLLEIDRTLSEEQRTRVVTRLERLALDSKALTDRTARR